MNSRSPGRLLLALAALALIAASCGSSAGNDTGAAAPGAAVASQETEGAEGPAAPILVGLADGGQLDWNSLVGQDVMLWFWAPW